MSHLTIALAQVNQAVGALQANADRIVRCAVEAVAQGAQVVVFPELSISGYPPEDLVLKRHFVADCEKQVRRLAADLPKQAVIIAGTPRPCGERACNAAVVFAGGRIVASYAKMALPNYGVFDEKRVFEAGARPLVLDLGSARIGLHICEDSWAVDEAPCTALRGAGLDALLNLSASPYHRGKLGLRESVLRGTAALLQTPLLYNNIVGGQDELVFDGASMAIAPDGTLLARARQFEEDLLFVDVPVRAIAVPPGSKAYDEVRIDAPWTDRAAARPTSPRVTPALDDLAEVYAALTLGLRDYVEKNGFRKVVVALSGGIDSALVATLAVDALGPDRVAGITMPSKFSSGETLGDAHLLARNLGIECLEVPIQHLQDTYLAELAPLWKGRAADTTEENLQARIRGNIVMALSNKFGWLVLTTGNKSELAVGYTTLYGDMCGGLAVISDVPKTMIYPLAQYINTRAGGEVIPHGTLTKPPSAELRENQCDQDTLPPYELLDEILEQYVEGEKSQDEIITGGHDPEMVRKVIRWVDLNEYKRKQMPPGLKVTSRAFGFGRRMPIAARFRY